MSNNILYYNTYSQNKDIVLDAASSINICVRFVEDIDKLYDIVISSSEIDILMVDYQGENKLVEVISSIYKYNKDIVIYVISHIKDDNEQLKLYSAGVLDYILFPVNKEVLKARLKNVVSLRNSRRRLNIEVENAVNVIKERELESLLLLGRISEYKDMDTAGHILRVGKYSALIMEKLGGSAAEQELMLYAAPLHDVGKIAIPDEIINKTTSLTEEEYAIMKTHTTKGYELLSGTKSKYLDAGAVIALSHHEKYDGTGYPNALKGDDIHIYGRIVAIADVFDALISERVYKNSWTLEHTLDYIKSQSGIHFDPEITDIFLKNISQAEKIIHKLPPQL